MAGAPRWKRVNWVLAVGILGILVVYLWRLRYGIDGGDEAFYLTIPYRLTRGDTLLVDEWHVSQLTGFLIWPLMALYRWIVPDTQGIVLAFRGIWLVLHLLVTTAAYFLLKPKSRTAATAAAILYGIFCPFGIMALSYNSIGLGVSFLLAILFFAQYNKPVFHVLKGILLAMLVLCNPYCVLVYAVLIAAVLVNVWRKGGLDPQLGLRPMLYLHLGLLLLLIPFLVHVWLGTDSLTQFLACLKNIVNDPEHPSTPFILGFYTQICAFLDRYPLFSLAFMFFFLVGYLKQESRRFCLGLLALLCCGMSLFDARYHYAEYGMNTCILFYAFAGLAAFFFQQKRDYRKLAYGFLFPLLYAFCMNISSNQGLYVIADAMLIASCLAPFFLSDFLKETGVSMRAWRPGAVGRRFFLVLTASVLLQIFSVLYVQTHHVFWENSIGELTAEITSGPMAGIRTTQAKADSYDVLLQELDAINAQPDTPVMVYRILPVAYLALECDIAAPSAWMAYSSLTDPRLLEYFQLNPKKKPQMVFIQLNNSMGWTSENYQEYADMNGYQITRETDLYMTMEGELS